MREPEEVIRIVFICDESYVMPTVVAMTSIYMNKKEDTRYSIHILASDISEESKKRFVDLSKEHFEVNILDLTQSNELKECAIENLHVSTAALYKFNIPNLFPNYEKILYLDGDILVQRDLTELYNTDISDVYAAVVKDYKPMTYNPPQVVKLGVNHHCYFNSGVMILNLEKMREDDLPKKLLDYRLHGINYFMDQDALNVVFQEKVRYLPLYFNVMSSVMSFFKFETLANYYELNSVKSKSEIYDEAIIVHLCTKYKPWDYFDVPFAKEWIYYYNHSTYTEGLQRRELEDSVRQKIFTESKVGAKSIFNKISFPVIVSLTSYPPRIQYVSQVINSLRNQTVRANKIILWLAEEQFPKKEQDLPEDLVRLVGDDFEIHWCDDLKSHKKYFYTIEKFPDSIVITVDDDIYYSNTLIETLLNSYLEYPYAVSAMRAHLITFDINGEVESYSKWKREYREVGRPSLALCATGVGGILYPPRIMHKELFNKQAIKELCLNADDLWLKIMQVMTYTPVVLACKPQKINNIEGSQKEALWKTNDIAGENDFQFSKILSRYNEYWGEKDTLSQRIKISTCKLDYHKQKVNVNQLSRELKNKKNEIQDIRNSWSYRIGCCITYIPRKIRGGIRCWKEHGLRYTIYLTKAKIWAKIGGSK